MSNIQPGYGLRLQLREAGRRTGERKLIGNPDLDGSGEVEAGAGYVDPDTTGAMIDGLHGIAHEKVDDRPLLDNLDPWKVRIPRMGRNAWERTKKLWAERRALLLQIASREFPLRTRFDILQAGRPLTPQELIEVREDIEAQKLAAFHIVQAQRARRRILDTLTRLGRCDSIEREGRRVIRKEVQIEYGEVSTMAYTFYVNGGNLPRGVSITDLYGDEVCTNLSVSVGHPVRSEISKQENAIIGLRYTVEIAATLGVPNLCKFSDMLPLMPPSAPPLAFLTGYAQGKRLCWADLERMPHLLGGGQTNGGKSNMMHVLTCSLIARNTPDQLRLLMIDLKFNGIEMARYGDLPHLIKKRSTSKEGDYVPEVEDGIATMPAKAIKLLEWVMVEANKRGEMFTRSGARDLRQWNRKHPSRRLPYIVVINDELAALRLDEEYGKRSYSVLQKLLAQGRAAGISFVTFTQSSNRQVLNELAKINLPGRICFSVPDISSSVLFVGDGSALRLTPNGRAIYAHGTERYLVQTPLIEVGDIAEVVANACKGKLTSKLTARPVLPEEIVEWCVEHNQGNLPWRDAFSHFGGELQRIDKETLLHLLREMDGKEYGLDDGRRYRVLPGIGSRPRKLEPVEGYADAGTAEPESQNGTQTTTESADRRCDFCGVTVEDPQAVTCGRCGAALGENE